MANEADSIIVRVVIFLIPICSKSASLRMGTRPKGLRFEQACDQMGMHQNDNISESQDNGICTIRYGSGPLAYK